LLLLPVKNQKLPKAKKAIATFKLRQGDPIGLVVTLRGNRMYAFYDRIVKIVLPRIKDFRGVSRKSFDGRGIIRSDCMNIRYFRKSTRQALKKLQGLEIISSQRQGIIKQE